MIQTYYGELNFNISVQNTATNTTEDYASLAHNSHSKTLPPAMLAQCAPHCRVSIRVDSARSIMPVIHGGSVDRTVSFDDTFSILVS